MDRQTCEGDGRYIGSLFRCLVFFQCPLLIYYKWENSVLSSSWKYWYLHFFNVLILRSPIVTFHNFHTCPNCKEEKLSYWVIPLMLSGFLHEMSTSACPLTVLMDSTRNSLGGPGLLSSANSSLLGVLNELVVYWLAAKTLNWCQTRGWSSTVTEFRVVCSHNRYIDDEMFSFNSTN